MKTKQNTNETNNLMVTNDISLAAGLKTAGFDLLELEKKEGIAAFVFESTPELREATKQFYNHKLVGDLLRMASEVKTLKRQIFE